MLRNSDKFETINFIFEKLKILKSCPIAWAQAVRLYKKRKMNPLISIGLIVYCCFSSIFGMSQIAWEGYDYLEIRLTYSHSFGGQKLVRLVQFSKDSCFYEYHESQKTELIEWWISQPVKRDKVRCTTIDKVTELFDSIESREILLHNDNVLISDGFMVSLEMTNGNSSSIYKIHSPGRKEEHIEDFKGCANSMLILIGEDWNKWIK